MTTDSTTTVLPEVLPTPVPMAVIRLPEQQQLGLWASFAQPVIKLSALFSRTVNSMDSVMQIAERQAAISNGRHLAESVAEMATINLALSKISQAELDIASDMLRKL